MKKLLSLVVAALLLLSSVPLVGAQEFLLYEEANFKPNDAPRQWEFTSPETGEYILFFTENYITAEIQGLTGRQDASLTGGLVYDLTAGQKYTVQASLKPECYAEYPHGWMDLIRVEKKQPLQRLYFFEEQITGQQYDSVTLQAFAEPNYYKVEGLKWSVSDSSALEIMDTFEICCTLRLKKKGTFTATATLQGKTAQCVITVEGMSGGDWESYPLWPAGQTRQQVTVSASMGAQLRYVPASDGWYVLYNESDGIHGDIRHASTAVNVPTKMAQVGSKNMALYQMTAGETYIVGVGADRPDSPTTTGTMVLEKAKPAQKVELYGPNMVSGSTIIGYVGGMQDLFAQTDPGYSYALTGDGFAFISSDPTMVEVGNAGYTGDPARNIALLRPGTCTVTVQAGGKEAKCTVTVLEPPALELGKKVTLQHSGYAVGATLKFTPQVSGTYSFTVSGAGGTATVAGTDIGMYFYNRTATMSGWLEGGKTYDVELFIEGSAHTVVVTSGTVPGGSSGGEQGDSPDGDQGGSQTPTPTVPGGNTDATAPVIPTPSQPQSGTDATTPTGGTQPTQPTEDTQAPPVQIPVKDGKATVSLEAVQQALAQAQPGGTVTLHPENAKVDTFELPVQALTEAAEAGVSLHIACFHAAVTLDTKAMSAIAQQATDTVQLQVETVTELSKLQPAQQQALEGKSDYKVFSLNLASGDVSIHDFGGGKATVAVQYDLNNPHAYMGEHSVYYLSPDGQLEKLESSFADNVLTFKTGHFSEYVIFREPHNGGSNSILIPVICIVAAVLAAGGVTALVLLKKRKTV